MKEIQAREIAVRQRYLEKKSSEIWTPNVGVITISGPAGTGKTTTGLEAAVRYQLPSGNFKKVGGDLRDEFGDMLGNRPLSKDIDIDELQAILIREATKDNPIVLEGRLSGIIQARIAQEFRIKGINLPVVSFLFICEETERMQRLTNRWNEDHPQNPKVLEEIRKEELQREKKDLEKWQKAHPDWRLKNPFNPGLKIKGEMVYARTIDTTGKSIDAVVEEMHRYLKEKGFIKRVA